MVSNSFSSVLKIALSEPTFGPMNENVNENMRFCEASNCAAGFISEKISRLRCVFKQEAEIAMQ